MKSRLALVVALGAGCSKTPDPPPAPPATPPATAADVGAPGPAKVKPRKPGDKHQPMDPDAPPLSLEVAVGSDVQVWTKDSFDKAAKYAIGSDGDARDVWSLRELATTLVGPGAHVVSVTGERGTKPMTAADWADPTKTPILHTTRRGTLKYVWADAQGTWGETVVKDVSRIEIAR